MHFHILFIYCLIISSMKKVILDTNFIMNCVSQKIDFFHDIKMMGIQILIPKQVLNELKRISRSSKKFHFREDAMLSLRIIDSNKENYKIIDVSKYGKTTDNGIRNYSEKNKDVIIATLDRGIKKKTGKEKMVIRGRKKIDIL